MKPINTPGAPQATGPFSQAITSSGFVFTAGQVGLTPEGKLIEGTSEEQTHQIMRNLQAILEAAGTDFSSVVKTTIYLTDMNLYATVNETYSSYMTKPYPARETVCVKALPLDALVEISMIAEVRD